MAIALPERILAMTALSRLHNQAAAGVKNDRNRRYKEHIKSSTHFLFYEGQACPEGARDSEEVG